MSNLNKPQILLKVLKEDGIEEIYLPKSRTILQPVISSGPSMSRSVSSPSVSIEDLQNQIKACTLCQELSSKRTQTVFGSGNLQAKLMFVGEAPGADEDEQGLPFVGRAGQLLTKIIESIDLKREDVFIANVLKCRPPGNRPPKSDEIVNCSPYLSAQIALIKPQIICALGNFAAQTLLQTSAPISQLRGKFYDQGSHRLICTYHPAYLLYSPGEKRAVWEDMKMIKKELEKLS